MPAQTVKAQTTFFSESLQCFLPVILVTSLLFDKNTCTRVTYGRVYLRLQLWRGKDHHGREVKTPWLGHRTADSLGRGTARKLSLHLTAKTDQKEQGYEAFGLQVCRW